MNTTIDSKIAGSLSPKVVEFLNENKILIPVINCLGLKSAEIIRSSYGQAKKQWDIKGMQIVWRIR